jgi:hypothetical protein
LDQCDGATVAASDHGDQLHRHMLWPERALLALHPETNAIGDASARRRSEGGGQTRLLRWRVTIACCGGAGRGVGEDRPDERRAMPFDLRGLLTTRRAIDCSRPPTRIVR